MDLLGKRNRRKQRDKFTKEKKLKQYFIWSVGRNLGTPAPTWIAFRRYER